MSNLPASAPVLLPSRGKPVPIETAIAMIEPEIARKRCSAPTFLLNP